MKKVLFSSLAMVFAFCLTAQRTVDLAVDEIIKPTMLNSTYVGNSAGTTVESQFVLRTLERIQLLLEIVYLLAGEYALGINNKFPKCKCYCFV